MSTYIMNSYVLYSYLPTDIIRCINEYIVKNSINTIIFYYRRKCEIKSQICKLFLYEKSHIRRFGIIDINRLPLILKAFKSADRWLCGNDDEEFWIRNCIFFKKELFKIPYYCSRPYEDLPEPFHINEYIHNICLKFNLKFYY